VIGVLASGEGTNLQALLDEGLLVVAVASDNTKARALDRAVAGGAEAAAFPAVEFDGREARDREMADWLAERDVDLVVLAGYMQILTAPFLDRFPGRILNVHPSLLPAHVVDEGVDTGPIVLQEAVAVQEGDTRETLHARIQEVEHRLLPRAVRMFLERAPAAAGDVRAGGEGET
jgi:phosphoribosylglycinamide formyltransferase-1